jgi:hypothetical protein
MVQCPQARRKRLLTVVNAFLRLRVSLVASRGAQGGTTMNPHHAAIPITSSHERYHEADTRLYGRWLLLARILWLVLVIPSLGFYVISLLANVQQLQQPLSPNDFQGSGIVILGFILAVVITVIWCGIGFLIFWRKSDDRLALLAAFFLVMYYITSPGNPSLSALASAYPLLTLPFTLFSFLGQASLGVFLLLFPNGRLIPRWTGLLLPFYILYTFFSTFPSSTSPFETSNWPGWLNLLVVLGLYVPIILAQIYRYRHVSTPVQRQQTKWVIFGVTIALGVIVGLIFIGFLIPSLLNTLFWNEVWIIIFPTASLLIPVSIGFSIMRYRLYEIDRLINRTLVYGTLTVLLALVYVGLVIGLQSLAHLFTGQVGQSPVIIVASTLAIAALFQPLRHRIQAIIDRRFYRRKYDAAKIVEAFSATLRNEVDLSQLREHLLNVVQDTMQPAHMSLWLRDPAIKPPHPDRKQP